MTCERICKCVQNIWVFFTLSWQSSLSYRIQSIDLQSKSMDWFLYNGDLRHERVTCLSDSFAVLWKPYQKELHNCFFLYQGKKFWSIILDVRTLKISPRNRFNTIFCGLAPNLSWYDANCFNFMSIIMHLKMVWMMI